jgi:putative nucleotidyltransferase with HDIG domain
MLRRGWRTDAKVAKTAGVALSVLLIAGPLAVALLDGPDQVGALSVILGVAAVAAGVLVEAVEGSAGISASFIVIVLAAAFLGPVSALIAGLLAEAGSAARARTSWFNVLYLNVPIVMVTTVATAAGIRLVEDQPVNTLVSYLTIGLAAFVVYFLSFFVLVALRRLHRPEAPAPQLGAVIQALPSALLSVTLAVAGVAVMLEIGTAGIAFALAAVFAFGYMAYLLRESRHRAEQYVSLSWGVLAGLMRSLDIRDERAARHSAAVARFARDIAREVGMSEGEQELAHTAGLLHDIGRFALSDRVAERGRTLTDEDWVAIQRHPELGADMLRDLGMYGPVAEIILAHHERIDGRGYPQALPGDEIPEIAKIISVAEVYDTLTASDTYRTRMSSFEALNELRRVAGSQLDARYIEVLAGLLTGEGVGYRHADTADFDSELNMERRIREAGAGG